MTREEKTDLFLEKLKEETGGYNGEEKKNAIRSLMNIRMPGELSEELIRLQDEYLLEERNAKGIVTLADIPTIGEQFHSRSVHADKVSLWQGDITRLEVGAIVNAANSQMLGCFIPCHRCIDNAIHSAAGMQLREKCNRIMGQRRLKFGRDYEEPTGTATLTPGYNLPCDHVIHTMGPIVYGALEDRHCRELRSCYENVLRCCLEHGISSVAFCCISTGEFHFPGQRAAEIAWKAVAEFLDENGGGIERVIFDVFTDRDFGIYERFFLG